MNDIAGYDILEKIGEGGMGQVYRAVHRRLGRPVAIKRLAPQLSQNQDMLRRFLQEARLQASLPHPNVVSIFDLVENDEGIFLIMEYVEGQTAREMLQGRGRLTMTETLMIAEGVLCGLAFMHLNGVVHRDIKPSNIMVSVTGTVKVTDFGIARLVNEETGLTRFAGGIGTLHYMAPELIKSGEVSFAIDIYSLGATLYELLAGAPPYTGNTDLEIMMGHLERELPPLDHLPDTPAGRACRALLAKALAKDPADRHASAEVFLAEVRQARELLRAEIPAALAAQAATQAEPVQVSMPAEPIQDATPAQAPPATSAGPMSAMPSADAASDATLAGAAPTPELPPRDTPPPDRPLATDRPSEAPAAAAESVPATPPVAEKTPAPQDMRQHGPQDMRQHGSQDAPQAVPHPAPTAPRPGRRKLAIGLGALVALGLVLLVFLTGQHRETVPPAPVATAPIAPQAAPAAPQAVAPAPASAPEPAETTSPSQATSAPAMSAPVTSAQATAPPTTPMAGATAPAPTPAAPPAPQQPAPAPAPAVEPTPAPAETAAPAVPETQSQAAVPASPAQPGQAMAPEAEAAPTPREPAPAAPTPAEPDQKTAVAPAAPAAPSQAPTPGPATTKRNAVVYTTVDARLREQPVISSDIIRTVDKGTRLAIQETRGEWLKVTEPEGQSGFIRADLTASRPPVAQTAPTPAAHRPSQPTPRPKLPKSPDQGHSGWRIVK